MSIIGTDQTELPGPPAEPKAAYHYKREADGIFRHVASRWLHERPTIDGRRTWKSLKTKNLKLAREEFRRRRSAEDRGENPYEKSEQPPCVEVPGRAGGLVGEALRRYEQDGFPDRHRKQRPEATRKSERDNVKALLPFWSRVQPEDITIALCDRYHDVRVKQITRGEGDRTVDLELNTLRNALLWGCRCELLKHMPMPGRWPRYHPASAVRHCREFMAHDAGEVHEIAGHLFLHGKSKVLAFQYVFESYTGLRTSEVLKLRTDAEPFTEGWMTPDGKSLCVRRVKGQADVNPFVAAHEGVKTWLEAHRKWKAEFYPDSPWYFPSPYDPAKPVDISALGHALRRLRKPTGRGAERMPPRIKRKITSHGCRAFYVTVRRSHGISDVQIGWELGHTSLGKTLADVYGGVPPHWLAGDGPRMSWLPSGKLAWEDPGDGNEP